MASDYTIGYGKPPVHSRFQKGKSGNPGGRPRPKTIAAVLGDALDRPATDPATGRRRRITRREALVGQLLDRCAENDLRAMKLLLDLLVKLEPRPLPTQPRPEDQEDPREILERMLDRLAGEFDIPPLEGDEEGS